MMSRFSVQHVRTAPRGYKIRTKRVGTHELRIAFPRGRRHRGAGKLIEILHPSKENPSACLPRAASSGRMNPGVEELLIFGNPGSRSQRASGGNPQRGAKAPRANPQPQARALYEEFHQMPAKEILEYDETQAMPKYSAVLGDLVAIGFDDRTEAGEQLDSDRLASDWQKCTHISFAGGDVKLAADPDGGQLLCVGGDQELSESALREMGARQSGGRYALGPAYFIVYNARKAMNGGSFDGYCHKFAENGGRRPSIYYDARQRRMLIRGGSYSVKPEGIVN
jgi:hypothetical protein